MPQGEPQGLNWTVQTHEHRERSVDWYWGLGLIGLAGAAGSVFFGNYLFAAIIAIAAGSVGALAFRGPREHGVHVGPRGLSIDGTVYRFDAIESFWVESFDSTDKQGQEPRLFVSTRGFLRPQLVIPLGSEARAQAVRAYLRRFVREEEQHAHIGTYLADVLGL